MNGVIYTRVSSDEQVKGMSLTFQDRDCRQYAATKGITILRVFEEEGESAKFADRPQLIELLAYCKKNRKKVEALIVWKIDRLSRVQMDYYFMKRMLRDYGVAIHSATEPLIADPSSIPARVFETFSALQAEIDNTIRTERTIRGMEERIATGIFPWHAPLGYLSRGHQRKGEKKAVPDTPDPERLPIIGRLFQVCRDEHVCGSVELAARANRWGLTTRNGKKIYPQAIDRIMANKFYAGVLTNPWKGSEHAGKHESIISVDDFTRVQRLRKGENPDAPIVRIQHHPDFPLRRFVRCSSCSMLLTAGWSTGRSGRHPYYHCAQRKCKMYGKAIRRADLEAAFVARLKKIAPTPRSLARFEETVLAVWKERYTIEKETAQKRTRRLRELFERLDSLMGMKERNLLTDEEFLTRKKALNDEMALVRVEFSETDSTESELQALLAYARPSLSTPAQRWLELTGSGRRRFQQIVFPEQISYSRGVGLGTAESALVYRLSGEFYAPKTRLVTLVKKNWNAVITCLRDIRRIAETVETD